MGTARGSAKQPKIVGVVGDINPLQYSGGVILDHGDGHPNLVWFTPIEWEHTDAYGDPTECEVYVVALDRRQLLGDVETKQDVYTLDHYRNAIPWGEIADSARGTNAVVSHGGCPYPPREYTEWWDASYRDMAAYSGQDIESLHEAECSADPNKRAWFYAIVASYYGWHEVGGDADKVRIAELRKRWALRMWRARKQGVMVYA